LLKHTFIFILLFSSTFCVYTQKTEINFEKAISELNGIGIKIISDISDEEKYIANEKFKISLKEVISNPNSFDYSFDSLKTISILKANKLKIYNWALPLTDGTFEYFAFLQLKKSNEEYTILELTDKSDEIKTPESKILTNKSWYGALYYKIIHDKKLGENYYTFLGWDGNNKLTNKKIIDVIHISNNGMVKFGAPIFKTEKKTKKRMIFEYTEDAVMSLKYYPKIGKIVFNQLDPIQSNLVGVYEYYAPNLKYFDALFIKTGKWMIEKNTDIRLERSVKDMLWVDPNGE
jgi:hypothetical protein